MSVKTFLLGVGAMKSGTTWLANSLLTCEKYAQGLVKEYHIFDTGHWFTERRDRDIDYLKKILNKLAVLE